MESTSELYIKEVAASVSYAHSKNIQIGGYNLMSSSREVGEAGECLNQDGSLGSASCLASAWSDEYFSKIKAFIEQTNFDMIETDGPYEGAKCANKSHTHHQGYGDSAWTQYERNMDFYSWCVWRSGAVCCFMKYKLSVVMYPIRRLRVRLKIIGNLQTTHD